MKRLNIETMIVAALITIPLAIALLKMFFPKDQQTLAVLQQMYHKAKEALKKTWKKTKKTENENSENSEQ